MVLSFIDVFQLLTVLFVTLSLLAMAMRKPAARGAGGGHRGPGPQDAVKFISAARSCAMLHRPLRVTRTALI